MQKPTRLAQAPATKRMEASTQTLQGDRPSHLSAAEVQALRELAIRRGLVLTQILGVRIV